MIGKIRKKIQGTAEIEKNISQQKKSNCATRRSKSTWRPKSIIPRESAILALSPVYMELGDPR